MVKLTREIIRKAFSTQTFNRGAGYYTHGYVHGFHAREKDGYIFANCEVEGTAIYDVSVFWDGKHMRASCTCPQAASVGNCKHMAAAFFALAEYQERELSGRRSNRGAQLLLHAYQKKNAPELLIDRSRKAQLVPQITLCYGDEYPLLSFRVGFDRLYVVKDIHEFLLNVNRGETVSYGKNLTLYHHMEQFDEQSQKLIALLTEQFEDFRSFSAQREYYGETSSGYRKNEIWLTGKAFDQFFDLYHGQSIQDTEKKEDIFLETCDPQITVTLESLSDLAQIVVSAKPQVQKFFGSQNSLYAVCDNRILRCSETFQQRLYPMLSLETDSIWMAKTDLPAFCSYVLPEIKDHVVLEDGENLLTEYIPDSCTACYYFELEDDVLYATLRVRYGDTIIPPELSPAKTPDIKRDSKAEQAARIPLNRYLNYNEYTKEYYIVEEDAIFTFLSETLALFHEYGEVYISKNIQRLQVGRKQVQAGVSVSDGMLTLNLDSGEFPPEELEALYHSMLQKKKYHRLKDGRYLELNGSPYEAMAEAAHMLQIAPKDLEQGSVTMPAFRALYLDQVLQDSDGLTVHRDKGVRAMLRAFKSVSDSDYTLPGDLESVFRPYQKYGFQWLKTLEANGFGGILADEMGLGKTAQTIAWLRTVPRETVGMPSLVVCPTSLILNWADECAKFAPDLKVQLILGNAAERRRCIEAGNDYDLWVTSYDLLKRDVELYKPLEFYGMVLDEAQYIKNKSTLASRTVKQINCRQRFVLTGTPIENRLSELWNLFDFLMPGYLFSHNAFVDKLEKPIAKSKNPEAGRRLSLMVQPFLLRRMKRDVLKELPPKMEHIHKIQLSEEERKVYQAFAFAAKNSLQGEGQGKLQILAALTRLRQLCCDPNLCLENYTGETSKLDACLDLCAGLVENGHQILVFSQFTSMLERLRERLNELNISSFTLQGSTPKEERAQLVKRFQAGGASVFLISLKAGGTGLNLTAADTVIHFDPWWNIAAQNQATDRAHRIGQHTSVHVYKLIAKDTIEEKIMELQSRKAELMDVITAETEESLRSMSTQELLELFDA